MPATAHPETAVPSGAGEVRLIAIAAYALYLAALINGLTAVIGVVLAYVKRRDAAGTVYESHYDNLISIFWTALIVFFVAISALVFGITGLALTVLGMHAAAYALLLPIAYIGGIAALVWFLYRTISGLLRAVDGKPVY